MGVDTSDLDDAAEEQDAAARKAAQADAETQVMGLSYATRFKGWVVCMMIAGIFMTLAFVIGLPVLALRPSKVHEREAIERDSTFPSLPEERDADVGFSCKGGFRRGGGGVDVRS